MFFVLHQSYNFILVVKDLTSQVDALTLRVSELEAGICWGFLFTVIMTKILANFTFSDYAVFIWGHSNLIDIGGKAKLINKSFCQRKIIFSMAIYWRLNHTSPSTIKS